MTELTDFDISSMSADFDNFIFAFCTKYDISALAFSGLALARLQMFSREIGYENEYYKMLNVAKENASIQTLNASPSNHIH